MAYVSTDFIKEHLYKPNMSTMQLWMLLREIGLDGFYRKLTENEDYVLLFRLCENGFDVDYVMYDECKGSTFNDFFNNYCKTMKEEIYDEELCFNINVVYTYVTVDNLYNHFLDIEYGDFGYKDKPEYQSTLL